MSTSNERKVMDWRSPFYMQWLDYQRAVLDGRIKFYPNNRIDRLMSDPQALISAHGGDHDPLESKTRTGGDGSLD